MVLRHFKATVGQRMMLWGAVLGILIGCYAINEILRSGRMEKIASELSASSSALVRIEDAAALFEKLQAAIEANPAESVDAKPIAEMVRAMAEIGGWTQGEVRERARQSEEMIAAAERHARENGEAFALLRQWPTIHEDLHLALNRALLDISARLKREIEASEVIEGGLGAVALLILITIVTLEYR